MLQSKLVGILKQNCSWMPILWLTFLCAFALFSLLLPLKPFVVPKPPPVCFAGARRDFRTAQSISNLQRKNGTNNNSITTR